MIDRDLTEGGVGLMNHLGMKDVTGGNFQREFVDLRMFVFDGCHVPVLTRLLFSVGVPREVPRRTTLRPRMLPETSRSG